MSAAEYNASVAGLADQKTAAPQDVVERLAALDDASGYVQPEISDAIAEIERLREWQRRALVVIECPSSNTIQDELKWLREASKP